MKKKEHLSHLFRGKRFSVEDKCQRKMRGWCDDPKSSDKTINIPYKGAELDDLTTIIHESLHACLWDIDEDSVEETSDSIAKLLWKLGWRKEK